MSETRVVVNDNPRVVIQDVVIVSKKNPKKHATPKYATGEFGMPEVFNGVMRTAIVEDPDKLIERLYQQVDAWVAYAAKEHSKNCIAGSNQLLPGKENNVTRLLTNEFFFYTKEPLTIKQFEKLMQRIVDLSKTYPENLHLLLGSFAVRTDNNKIMNIVPHVECGKRFKVNFAVKNHPSSIDPKYYEVTQTKPFASKVRLDNVSIENDKIDQLSITLDSKRYPFGFHNIFECKTAGGVAFHSVVEICLDHGMTVAKKRFHAMLQHAIKLAEEGVEMKSWALQSSHVFISNTAHLIPARTIGDVTQADPGYSPKKAKGSIPTLNVSSVNQSTFGTPANVITMPSLVCGDLPMFELRLVDYFNAVQKFIAEYRGPKADIAENIQIQFASRRSRIMENALIEAVSSRDFGLVTELIDNNKVDPNVLSNTGVPATTGIPLLFFAIANEDYNMLIMLLSKGANPWVAAKQGETVYEYAHRQKIELIQHIRKNPPVDEDERDKNQNRLNMLTMIIVELSKKIADLAKEKTNEHGSVTQAAIYAVIENNVDLVKFYLDNQLSANAQSELDDSLLFFAARRGREKMVALLLGYGADPHLANKAGNTPYDVATENNNRAILKMFDNAAPKKNAAMQDVIQAAKDFIVERSTSKGFLEFFGGDQKAADIAAAKALIEVADGKAKRDSLQPHLRTLVKGELYAKVFQKFIAEEQAEMAVKNRKGGPGS